MPSLSIIEANTTLSLQEWMKHCQSQIESALAEFLPPVSQVPQELHEAMAYAVLGGGKRVRPLLVYAAGQLFDAPHKELTRAACAVEMIHAYSLVHDDMPCMDDDSLRRGKPTVHVKYNEAAALLVGDALQSQAFMVLANGHSPATRQLQMVQILAHASGSAGMCGGQAIDLASVGLALSREALEQMHQLKTGALLRASVQLGALCGKTSDNQSISPDEFAALSEYSRAIGLAFQVVDDILDATASSVELGKTAGKDAADNKPTYVSILGLDASRALAETLRKQAHHALSIFSSAKSQRLIELADYIVQRST